jgi:hypothetical protein
LRTFRGDSKFEYFFFFGEIVQLFQFIIVFFVFLYTTYCTEFKNIWTDFLQCYGAEWKSDS